jgi:hypothetical protein
MSRATWDPVLDQMMTEIDDGSPRAETYWAQQLAFGPVLVHALRLRLRDSPPSPEQARRLARCVDLAFGALGSLPDTPGEDPIALRLLAARQARAISWRRRLTLARLLERLGEPAPGHPGVVPSRMTRPYPLIGFRPGERLAG